MTLGKTQSSSYLFPSAGANLFSCFFFLLFPLTTRISFPFFQSFPASPPFTASNLAWQFLAMAALTLVRVWSELCSAVLLLPLRSRPLDPV